jgi:lipid-A-disaccharide synthase
VRELVAADMNVANVKEELGKILKEGGDGRAVMLAGYERMLEILGEAGASQRAAAKMVELLKKGKRNGNL